MEENLYLIGKQNKKKEKKKQKMEKEGKKKIPVTDLLRGLKIEENALFV